MKEKKKLSPLWLIPAVVVIALILWCIRFPLTTFADLDKDAVLSDMGVVSDEVGKPLEEGYLTTSDAQQLAEIKDVLRGTRCRFFGWYSYITYNDAPLQRVFLSGRDKHGLFTIQFCADSDGYIYIDTKGASGIRVRARDGELYDYLTALLPQE